VVSQLIGVGIVLAYDVVASLIILFVIDLVLGLRVEAAIERDGRDPALHGETVE
jgi:Amt family ammonium transporter